MKSKNKKVIGEQIWEKGARVHKKEVVKASGAIQMTNKISLLQRRTWNILLANAFDDLLESEEHHIEIKQLINTLEYGSKNEDHLKDSLRELTTTGVEWNLLQKDKTAIWGITTLLSQVEIKEGRCTYAYSPALKKKLFQPRMYAKINLFIQNKFDSKHSLALYEICVDYYDRSRKRGETPFIPIEDFRKLMGIEDHEYTEFKYLNKRTISEPLEEINAKADIAVRVIYKRSGRKISHVKFSVEPQNPGYLNPTVPLKDSADQIFHEHGFSEENLQYYKTYIPQEVLEEFIREFQDKMQRNLIRYPRPYLATVLGKLVTQYHTPLAPPSHSHSDVTSFPVYLQFLVQDQLLDPKTNELLLLEEDRRLPLKFLEQYSEEFWGRVLRKYRQLKEKSQVARIEMAFVEAEREEDFINHPVYTLLLERAESKSDYQSHKLQYLQKITDLYWQVIEKEVELEKVLQNMNEQSFYSQEPSSPKESAEFL